MTRILAIAFLLVAASLTEAFPTAPTYADQSLRVKIGKNATLIEGGQAVIVRLQVRCDPGLTVLEAFVYVTQSGNQSQFAAIPVTCDAKPHWFEVGVPADPDLGPLSQGAAQASAYVLLENGAGTTISTSPTREINIR